MMRSRFMGDTVGVSAGSSLRTSPAQVAVPDPAAFIDARCAFYRVIRTVAGLDQFGNGQSGICGRDGFSHDDRCA